LRLRQLVPWARTAGFAVAALGLLDGLISYRTPVSLLIGVGLNGWLIYVLCRPDAIATFPSASVPTDLRAIRDVWPSRRGRRPQSRMRGRVRP
jgi:hypothetical protein